MSAFASGHSVKTDTVLVVVAAANAGDSRED